MFIVNENKSDVFTSDNFDLALHEMMSILNARISILPKPVTPDQIADIYIEEYVPAERKRFRYITNKYTFDLKTLSLQTMKSNVAEFSYPCQQIFESVKKSLGPPVPVKQQQIYTGVNLTLPNPNPITPIQINPNSLLSLPPRQEIRESVTELSYSDDDDDEEPNKLPDSMAEDPELKSLEAQIESIKSVKRENKNKMKELRQMQEQQTEKLIDYSADVNYTKKKLFQDREREEEKRKKFNANKRAYFLMKEDINKDKLQRNKISPLFHDYPIFEYLDEKNLLTPTNENYDDDQNHQSRVTTDYFLYNELTKKDKPEPQNDTYVPHDYNYLSKEEQDQYTPFLNNKKGMIEDFLARRKRIKPIAEILRGLDNDDNDDTDENEIISTDDSDTKSAISDIPDIKIDST